MEKAIIKGVWNFDNSYACLPKLFFSSLKPTPVRSPKLVIFNAELAAILGLDEQACKSGNEIEVFAGNRTPQGALPIAQAYAGHQFGNFTMLGDGRALLLGEQITPKGERFDIQLKGSGKTPYSRRGDGRAALGPMLREYIISEAMHGLGIPTTRSLAVVTTGETVFRETSQPGAVLTRVAASHIRVGTFQYAAEWGTIEDVRVLANYTMKRHFSAADAAENRYLVLLHEAIRRQAALIAKWQLVGFIHGVMNTDNAAISGETIDYGPCAFMDAYNPETVFSSIDLKGRYAYGNQPYIAGWNLARFAETLLPLLHENQEQAVKLAQDAVSDFTKLYRAAWLTGMRAKLGMFNEEEEDDSLFEDLLRIMAIHHADYTNTFRALTLDRLENLPMFTAPDFIQWYKLWQKRLARQGETKEAAHELMKNSNPAIIPRNHQVEAALDSAVKQGDYSVLERLVAALSSPYAYSFEQNEYSMLPQPSAKSYRTFCGT